MRSRQEMPRCVCCTKTRGKVGICTRHWESMQCATHKYPVPTMCLSSLAFRGAPLAPLTPLCVHTRPPQSHTQSSSPAPSLCSRPDPFHYPPGVALTEGCCTTERGPTRWKPSGQFLKTVVTAKMQRTKYKMRKKAILNNFMIIDI